MIGAISQALLTELRQIFLTSNTTILFDTELNFGDLPSHSMPLICLEIENSPTYNQLPGGATKLEWDFNIYVYTLSQNSQMQPDNGFSTDLLNTVEVIRKYFAKKLYTSTEMLNIIKNYQFNLTLSGIIKADKIQSETGNYVGFKMSYQTVAIDTDTMHTKISTEVLEYIELVTV